MARRRQAFTLIELLVVMGIILLLLGIAVIAYQKLDRIAGERTTRARLQTCVAMMNEYEIAVGLGQIEGTSGIYKIGATYSVGGGLNFNDSIQNSQRLYIPTATSVTPVSLPFYTGRIMSAFSRVPAVKSMLAQLPGQSMLTGTYGSGPWVDASSYIATGPGGANYVLPVVVDGWKNPIVYVPSGGLTNVYLNGPLPSGAITTNALPYNVKSIDGRPFWASAGQDGDLATGDDNIYSCPVTYTLVSTPP